MLLNHILFLHNNEIHKYLKMIYKNKKMNQ